MNKHPLKYVPKKFIFQLISLQLIQQLLVALGTYALAEMGKYVHDSVALFFWLSVCILSFIVSPFFAIWIRPLEIKASYAGYQSFLNEKLINKKGKVSIWTEKNQREVFLASIGSEAESYLSAIVYVWLDLFSFVLSLALGISVLGLIIDIKFIPAYIISAVFSFIVYRLYSEKIKNFNETDQNQRTLFGSFILKSWDNIFFNNKNLQERYQNEFTKKFNESLNKSKTATAWNEFMVASLTLVSSLPVVLTVFWSATENIKSEAIMIGLLATLPRQFNLLTTYRSIFQSIGSLISFESKFKSLSQNADISVTPMIERIKLNMISINGETVSNMPSLKQNIQQMACGRYVIKASNGAGKSSLLTLLNCELDNSVFLPANPDFYISGDQCAESTGEKMLRHFDYVASLPEKILLLDEWDANLDHENTQKLNLKIDALSKIKVIIEVRHKH